MIEDELAKWQQQHQCLSDNRTRRESAKCDHQPTNWQLQWQEE